jgi:hypothetical protein
MWNSTVRNDSNSGRESLPKPYLDLLVYVLHTEAAACLSNHVLRFSRFSYQKNDSWVASITLRCWKVGDKGPDPKRGIKRATALSDSKGKELLPPAEDASTHRPKEIGTKVKDDEMIFLPLNSKKVWGAHPDTSPEKLSFELVHRSFGFPRGVRLAIAPTLLHSSIVESFQTSCLFLFALSIQFQT